MKKLLSIFAILLASTVAFAQPPPAVTASQVTIPAPYLPAVIDKSVSLVGNPGPAKYCYWIVANYTLGNAAPSFAGCIRNGPNTLTSSNYDVINYTPPIGATSADVLRTSMGDAGPPPSGACNCAVATGDTSGSVNDQSNTLNSYTVATLNSVPLAITLTVDQISAGVAHLRIHQGNFVGDLSAASVLPGSSLLSDTTPVTLNFTTGNLTQDFKTYAVSAGAWNVTGRKIHIQAVGSYSPSAGPSSSYLVNLLFGTASANQQGFLIAAGPQCTSYCPWQLDVTCFVVTSGAAGKFRCAPLWAAMETTDNTPTMIGPTISGTSGLSQAVDLTSAFTLHLTGTGANGESQTLHQWSIDQEGN